MTDKPIFVTQPSLPPIEELTPYLETIWKNKWLTNCGPFHNELEVALCKYLKVRELALFNNGTMALIAALKIASLTGEVITTPFSFVATSHALLWNNLTPVFVDIDPENLNLDPAKIEAAITSNTSAILAVHCYGNPCDTKAIQAIADKHGLKVIYDAAHAFGVEIKDGSILNAGDMSILSFHATKIFNTLEGGAIICHDEDIKKSIDSFKNFGITSEETVGVVGLNGKMDEFNAAFGLLQLKYIDQLLAKRKVIAEDYQKEIDEIDGINYLSCQISKTKNYAYFPVLIGAEYPLTRDELYAKLKSKNIFTRRYFYPLITSFEPYKDIKTATPDNVPVATEMADKVLCLPIFPDLTKEDFMRIINVLRGDK
ncbi:MAG: aminotransferase [Zetaproteobacteria bacterium]|nr:MAG: aminotransferase [Zetaproteobacteria bacterium]